MELRKVTAIIRTEFLERVENRLEEIRVSGITVTHVKGYGEYANFYTLTHDLLVRHARIEIFTEKSRAEEIAREIVEAAHSGTPGDGIVVILPVERIFRIRTKTEPPYGEI